jgi:plastocyanin
MRPVTASTTVRAPEQSARKRRLPAFAAGVLLLALAVAASGCSVKGNDNANLIEGKQAFVAKCGSCHTLARANTKGIVGPNLDEAFRASIAEGLERNAIRGVVEHQVEFPNREGVMPGNLVRGATVGNVAAYVAQAADRPGPDTGLLASAVEAPGAGKPAVEKAGKLEIPANATGQLAYQTNKATATPGAVTITMPNMSGVSHNIAVEAGTGGANPTGGTVLGASSFISKGSTSVTVTLKPGSYTFFCQAPGHRAAGMFGTLTVK